MTEHTFVSLSTRSLFEHEGTVAFLFGFHFIFDGSGKSTRFVLFFLGAKEKVIAIGTRILGINVAFLDLFQS